MKKILYSVMAIAALTFSFTSLTSCEDVPAPYEIPGEDPDTPDTPAESSLPYTDTNLSDWKAVTTKGAAWSLGSTYAKATGYNGSTYDETEAWLVSPKINIGSTTGAVINFDNVIRYAFNESDLNNHEMYISSDYSGDVEAATWTKLGYKPVASSTNTWDFYAANTIAVPQEYLGKEVVVAFKFVCSSSNSTTWEIKNFSITEGTGGDQPTPDQPVTPDQPSDDSEALNETFASSIGSFSIINITMGDGMSFVWKHDASYKQMKASAYVNKKNLAAESWLVSPKLDLSKKTDANLSFEQALNFLNGNNRADYVSVLASTDYNGDVAKANWTELSVENWPDGTNWTFGESKANMKAFAGKSNVTIAFKYTSNTSCAPTWEIKNVVVK